VSAKADVGAQLRAAQLENRNLRAALKLTRDALSLAEDHLDWIGWGDTYERQCAKESGLGNKIQAAIRGAKEVLK